MAILWSEFIGDNHYEVRTAGASIRLYRNGVHHSQFNPNRPLAGGIWDLLTITTLFREPESVQQALILGFGAGAAGRLLRELSSPTRVVGIELDPIHLSIADSFFECSEGCELIAADAVEWMGHGGKQPDRFDWLLDDLYTEADGLPVRCGPSSLEWFELLANRLTEGGMLVINLVEPDEIESLPPMVDPGLKQRFPHVVQLSLAGYDNRVLALSRVPFESGCFSDRLHSFCQRYPACRRTSAKYRIEHLRTATD